MAQSIVITSTGRTGTIFFSKLIGDMYADVAAYHERGFSRPFQILTNAYYANLFPKSGLKFAWHFFKEQEIKRCVQPIHLDANCFLYGIFSAIPDLQPGIKIIHIVRDPRTYVTSHLNFSRFRRASFVANYLVPLWQPSPFLMGEISWKRLFSLSRMERYAWIWVFKNRIIESLENTDIPYLRVRFEDVFNSAQPEIAFKRITDFIGLPERIDARERFSQRINQAPKDKFSEWQDWSVEQSVKFYEVCGEMMEKYGYGREADWFSKLGQSNRAASGGN